jgi:hypothetical protein
VEELEKEGNTRKGLKENATDKIQECDTAFNFPNKVSLKVVSHSGHMVARVEVWRRQQIQRGGSDCAIMKLATKGRMEEAMKQLPVASFVAKKPSRAQQVLWPEAFGSPSEGDIQSLCV